MNPQMNYGMNQMNNKGPMSNYTVENIFGKRGNYPNQNINPQLQIDNFFISGKIGKKLIKGEYLDSFKLVLRESEWTNNTIYKKAQNCEVKTTIQQNSDEGSFQPFQSQNNFNSFMLEPNEILSNFNEYVTRLEGQKIDNREITQKRMEFITKFLSSSTDMDYNSIIAQIKVKRNEIISMDPELNKKISFVIKSVDSSSPPAVMQSVNQIPQNNPYNLYQPRPQVQMPTYGNNNYYQFGNMNLGQGYMNNAGQQHGYY